MLPGFILLGGMAAFQARRGTAMWAVQLVVGWLLLVATIYPIAGIHRFLGMVSLRWLFMVLSLLLGTLIPVAVLAAIARRPRLRDYTLGRHLGIMAVLGALMVPVAGLIATMFLRIYMGLEGPR